MPTAEKHEIEQYSKSTDHIELRCTCGWKTIATSPDFAAVIRQRHLSVND